MPGTKLKATYRCTSKGQVNNGLKESCDFEFKFDEGDHNCPLCGSVLLRLPAGKSVTQLLQEGMKKYR
tara:strand:+ start:1581 stop:1784 length:204 start_codon:yes stop_codon:yes gene_type:complete